MLGGSQIIEERIGSKCHSVGAKNTELDSGR